MQILQHTYLHTVTHTHICEFNIGVYVQTLLTIGPQTNHEDKYIITPHKTIQYKFIRVEHDIQCACVERHCTCTHASNAYGAKRRAWSQINDEILINIDEWDKLTNEIIRYRRSYVTTYN